jgi:ethanolamine permease
MLALFKLRRTEPDMVRPFSAPLYPWFPLFALLGALVCLVTMVYYNFLMAVVFVCLLLAGYGVFLATTGGRAKRAAFDAA